MKDPAVTAMWEAYVAASGVEGSYTAWPFGSEDTPDLADELAALVPRAALMPILRQFRPPVPLISTTHRAQLSDHRGGSTYTCAVAPIAGQATA